MRRRLPRVQSQGRAKSVETTIELKAFSRAATTLAHQNSRLYQRAASVYQQITDADVLEYQTLPGFTNHGKRHIHAVLMRADQLLAGIGQRLGLSAGEHFLLLVSILLHDSGMLIYDFLEETPLDVHLNHGDRTKELISARAARFGITSQEAELVATIASSHCFEEYQSMSKDAWSIESLGPCRLHVIMALLRMADLFDLTYSRAPEFVFGLRVLPGTSKKHWERHSVIHDIGIDYSDWTITLFVRPETIKQEMELERFRLWLESEVSKASKDLRIIGLMYSRVVLKIDDSVIRREVRPTAKSNPYKGLFAFESRDSESFFARDREIDTFTNLVVDRRFVTLVGASGVGKSSLVNAGILPRLAMMGAKIASCRLSQPICESLLDVLGSAMSKNDRHTLESVEEGLSKLDRRKQLFVLYIDQFEELFTLPFPQDSRDSLVDILDKLIREHTNFRVLVSIRSEFFYNLWELAKRKPEFLKHNSDGRLAKLGREGARLAIELPLKQFRNLRWQPELIDAILDDLTDENAGVYPPFLQLLCYKLVESKFEEFERLSDEECQGQFIITIALYKKLGGADTIINDHFAGILKRFSPNERDVLRRVLSRMITEYNSRRPIHHEEVQDINQGMIDIEKAMQRLIDARIVTKIYFGYELVHDLVARKLVTLIESSVRISSQLHKVILFIQRHKREQLSVIKLAKIANLSPSQFTRRFKAETGQTPAQFILTERVNDARWMLTETEDPIAHVAASCGFASADHFTTVFKKLNSELTPRDYRIRSRESRAAEYR